MSFSDIANHLWQSTIFAGLAALLALALRGNRAQTRYWVWLAASMKFLVPFGLLVSMGSRIEWQSVSETAPVLPAAIEQIGQPFAMQEAWAFVPAAATSVIPMWVLVTVWCAGFGFVLFRWHVRWRRIRSAVRQASPLPIEAPVKVMSSPSLLEPGVFGLFRPMLLLPEGIASRLSPAQLRAILAHEMCHVRRRDNLASAVHMLAEAVFWFHPLIWWIGARMVEARERACDEEVLRLGNPPEEYAAGILNVCKFYLESPLPCAAGVTGADLKKRIEGIMTNRISQRLTIGTKLLLASAGIAAVSGPVLFGVLHAEKLTFEVASVKPGDPDARGVRIQFLPGGGMRVENSNLKAIVGVAYHVQNFQISGAPGWFESEKFSIDAKAPNEAFEQSLPNPERHDRIRQRLQALLAERFKLEIRHSTTETPGYALVVGKNGHKMKETSQEDGIRGEGGQLIGMGASMDLLARLLSSRLRRPVVDKTGLAGRWEFTMRLPADVGGLGKDGPAPPPSGEKPEGPFASDPGSPSLLSVVQEQLGLKLEAHKAPLEHLTIVRVERPTAN